MKQIYNECEWMYHSLKRKNVSADRNFFHFSDQLLFRLVYQCMIVGMMKC